MFRFKPKRKSKAYQLRTENQSIKIPLIFHGKSVELNSQALNQGKYTLLTEDQKHNGSTSVIVL